MQRHPLRVAGLALLMLAPLAALMLLHDGPLMQDPAYHAFADARRIQGIPHFANIVSNMPFLLVGCAGLWWCRRLDGTAARSWRVFFAGVALVTVGSAYYHAAPDDGALLWDRLPMAVAFMALFAALLVEHLHLRRETVMLLPALAIGVASVLWWHWSGDLRFYVWVQGAPLLAIPYLVAAFPGKHLQRHVLLYGVGWYALAKAAEFRDQEIWILTGGLISGHSAKHLLAAAAAYCVLRMLQRRAQSFTPVASSQ